jgi:hypothetical protein
MFICAQIKINSDSRGFYITVWTHLSLEMEADHYKFFCQTTDGPLTMSLGNSGLGGSVEFIDKYYDVLFLGRPFSVGGVGMQVRKTLMLISVFFSIHR